MKSRCQLFFQNDLDHVGQQDGRQVNHQGFLWRERELVGKANLFLEIFAAAFGIEMPHQKVFFKLMDVHVLMVMSKTMFAEHGSVAETAHQVVILSAKMKIDVQSVSNEQHIYCQQNTADLKEFSFHGTKLKKIPIFAVLNIIT